MIPATFFVQEVYLITNFLGRGQSVVLAGKVQSGPLSTSMKASIMGINHSIAGIEKNHVQITEAKSGDNIGVGIRSAGFQGADLAELKRILTNYKNKTVEFSV